MTPDRIRDIRRLIGLGKFSDLCASCAELCNAWELEAARVKSLESTLALATHGVERLTAEVERLKKPSPRMFPLLTERGYKKPFPLHIPWSVAEKAYGVYASRYGKGQSLERLAQRGGFGPGEMDEFHPGWLEECSEVERLERENAELRAAIRGVVTKQGDNICWRDVYTDLAKFVGIEFCPQLMVESEQFIGNCKRFDESLRSGKHYVADHADERPPAIAEACCDVGDDSTREMG